MNAAMTGGLEGYSVHHDVFQRAEMRGIFDALDRAALTRTKAGARHVLAVPAVRALASDRRLLGMARGYVGPNAFPYRATLFDKSASTNWLVTWHQDTALPLRNRIDRAGWGPWSVKAGVLYAIAPATALHRVIALRIHLNDSTEANGPLRVLPNTDVLGVLGHNDIQKLATKIAPVDCLTNAGGVVTMRPLTVHASSKARTGQPRRVLHIEYAAKVNLDDGIELAVG